MIAPLILLFGLLLVVRTGTSGIINLGDSLFPFFPQEHFRRFFYVWDPHEILGRDFAGLLSQLPWYSIPALLDWLGLPLWLTNRVWFVLPFCLLGLAMFFLSGVVFGEDKKTEKLIATLFFMFNPFSLNLVQGSNILTISFAAGVFVFAFFVRGLSRRSGNVAGWEDALLVGLASVFASANIVLFVMTLLLCFAYFIFFVVVNQGNRRRLSYALKFSLLAVFYSLLANSWWLLPFAYQFLTPGYFGTLFGAGTDISTFEFVAQFTSLFDVSRLFYGMRPTANFPISAYYHYLLAPTTMSVLVVLVFAVSLFRKKSKLEIFFLLLAWASVILASGTRPPFGFVYQFLWDHLSYFHIFRTTNRFNLYTMISYGILLGFLYQQLTKFRTSSILSMPRFHKFFIASFLLISIFLSSWPLLSGDIYGQLKPHRIPQDYDQLREFLKEREGDFRVLSLPQKDWLTPYTWSAPFDMQEILIDFSPKDTVVNLPGHLQDLKNRDIIESDPLYALVYRWPERPEALDALRKMGVRYLVVHRDYAVIWGNYYPLDVQKLTETLQKIEGVNFIRSFGDLDVYEVDGFYPRVYSMDGKRSRETPSQLGFKKVSPVEYQIQIKEAREPFDLVFAENFNNGWRLEGIGSPGSELERGFGNVWRIEQTGDYQLRLYYWPQKIYQVGLLLSVLSILVGGGMMVGKRWF